VEVVTVHYRQTQIPEHQTQAVVVVVPAMGIQVEQVAQVL
jgi:hypothetical protein